MKVLETAMNFWERRIEKEMKELDTAVNKKLGETDKQLEAALTEVNQQITESTQTVQKQSELTEAELDDAIQAAELALTNAQKALDQSGNVVNVAAVNAIREDMQRGFAEIDELARTAMEYITNLKDEAMEYVRQNLVPYGPAIEQYAQSLEDSKNSIRQQLGR